MIDAALIERELRGIVSQTEGLSITDGYWLGDEAAKRQVADNFRAGRLQLQAARRNALNGLDAIKRGDLEYADLARREAKSLLLAAFASRLKPSQIEDLMRDASPRGRRRSNDERDKRLAEEVTKQEAAGLIGPHARQAAIKADAILKEAFRGMGDAAIRAAVRRGKEIL